MSVGVEYLAALPKVQLNLQIFDARIPEALLWRPGRASLKSIRMCAHQCNLGCMANKDIENYWDNTRDTEPLVLPDRF